MLSRISSLLYRFKYMQLIINKLNYLYQEGNIFLLICSCSSIFSSVKSIVDFCFYTPPLKSLTWKLEGGSLENWIF